LLFGFLVSWIVWFLFVHGTVLFFFSTFTISLSFLVLILDLLGWRFCSLDPFHAPFNLALLLLLVIGLFVSLSLSRMLYIVSIYKSLAWGFCTSQALQNPFVSGVSTLSRWLNVTFNVVNHTNHMAFKSTMKRTERTASAPV
jgi:hypothetical protein